MKRKHGSIRELAECQAKPLPLTPPLRLLPASIAATAPANFAKTVFSIPHGARTRRVPNGCATPRLAASSASQSHTRRQSGGQPTPPRQSGNNERNRSEKEIHTSSPRHRKSHPRNATLILQLRERSDRRLRTRVIAPSWGKPTYVPTYANRAKALQRCA